MATAKTPKTEEPKTSAPEPEAPEEPKIEHVFEIHNHSTSPHTYFTQEAQEKRTHEVREVFEDVDGKLVGRLMSVPVTRTVMLASTKNQVNIRGARARSNRPAVTTITQAEYDMISQIDAFKRRERDLTYSVIPRRR